MAQQASPKERHGAGDGARNLNRKWGRLRASSGASAAAKERTTAHTAVGGAAAQLTRALVDTTTSVADH